MGLQKEEAFEFLRTLYRLGLLEKLMAPPPPPKEGAAPPPLPPGMDPSLGSVEMMRAAASQVNLAEWEELVAAAAPLIPLLTSHEDVLARVLNTAIARRKLAPGA